MHLATEASDLSERAMTSHRDACLYAAGLFDGEGSVTFCSSGKTAKVRTLRVSLGSTDKGLTQFLEDTFGGRVYPYNSKIVGRKPMYEWKANNAEAVDFLRAVRPFMREANKIARADLVLTKLAWMIGCDYRWVHGYSDKRIAIEAEILAIR